MGFKHKFAHPERITLTELRKHAQGGPLEKMQLLRQTRLSVIKVSAEEWNFILDLADCPQYKVDIPEADISMVDSTYMTIDAPTVPQEEIEQDMEVVEEQVEEQLFQESAQAEQPSSFIENTIEDVQTLAQHQLVQDLINAAPDSSTVVADEVAEQVTKQIIETIEEATVAGAEDDVIQSTEIVAEAQIGMY